MAWRARWAARPPPACTGPSTHRGGDGMTLADLLPEFAPGDFRDDRLADAELASQGALALTRRIAPANLRRVAGREFGCVMRFPLRSVPRAVDRQRPRQPSPSLAGDRLAHCSRVNAELAGQILLSFPCRVAPPAFQHDRLGELGGPAPFAPVTCAVSHPIRAGVLRASPVTQVRKAVVKPAARAVQRFHFRGARPPESQQDELVNKPGLPPLLAIEHDHQVPAAHRRGEQVAAYPGPEGTMQAPDVPEVAHLVQAFIARDGQPPLIHENNSIKAEVVQR